ncbi:MAG: hypothetical protein Q8N69_00675 [bacterium]|nr:hypothetical protein [bacterium]
MEMERLREIGRAMKLIGLVVVILFMIFCYSLYLSIEGVFREDEEDYFYG